MFNFLKGGKAQVNVTVDHADQVYHVGETVHARINVIGEKDLKIQQGRVTFLYSEEYQYRHEEYETDSNGNRETVTHTDWKTVEQQLAQTAFLPETTIAAGSNQNFEFDFAIPPNAPPTAQGKIIHIKWLVKATLDRKLASDVEAKVELTVVNTPSGQHAGEGRYGNSSEPLEADLQLVLPALEFVLGESISGTLAITPNKSFDVNEVRIALVQLENVPEAEGNTSVVEQKIKLSPQVKLQAGQPMSFPFNITVPSGGSPSCQTPNGTIGWLLSGTLARRLRKDTNVEESVAVYTVRGK